MNYETLRKAEGLYDKIREYKDVIWALEDDDVRMEFRFKNENNEYQWEELLLLGSYDKRNLITYFKAALIMLESEFEKL